MILYDIIWYYMISRHLTTSQFAVGKWHPNPLSGTTCAKKTSSVNPESVPTHLYPTFIPPRLLNSIVASGGPASKRPSVMVKAERWASPRATRSRSWLVLGSCWPTARFSRLSGKKHSNVTLWLCQNNYWKWQFIVDLIYPLKIVVVHTYVSLPEGKWKGPTWIKHVMHRWYD